MTAKTKRSYPPDGDGPVTWADVDRVLRALMMQAACGRNDPNQKVGPLNEELIKVVQIYRARRDRVIAKLRIAKALPAKKKKNANKKTKTTQAKRDDVRDVRAGDIEAYALHQLVARIARDLRAGAVEEASVADDEPWPLMPGAVEALRSALEFEAGVKVDHLAALAGDEAGPTALSDAIGDSGGPTQYADQIMKQVAPPSVRFGRHTREAVQKALEEKKTRSKVLAHAPPDLLAWPTKKRPSLLRYAVELLAMSRRDECEAAIEAVWLPCKPTRELVSNA